MVTNFFWIGYHFEEFRSQVAIRKKKLISRPVYPYIILQNGKENTQTYLVEVFI